MTNEKLNNDNWKAKLEDADALKEYALQNKNAAWENLHDKLHEKQQPKFLWHWMAAACLITVIIVVSFLHHPVNNDTTVRSSVKTKPQQNTVAQQPSQQSTIQKINTTHDVVKIKPINSNINKSTKQVIDKNKVAITDSIVVQHNELANVKVELPVLEDSIVQTTTAITVVPKKLKIVHVNELDDDGSNINMVQNKGHIPSRIKFLNQDIYTDYTLSVPASSFSILKNKNSTSN